MLHLFLSLMLAGAASDSLPLGQVIPDVKCMKDASQSYALYLPSNYTSDHAWPVILGFDPGGRGRNAVDRYQAAAEKYGYIVAGSNNSRNGSTETGHAAATMGNDVFLRFNVDPKRIYTAGMSGGAWVAFSVAFSSMKIAGVFASSAVLSGREIADNTSLSRLRYCRHGRLQSSGNEATRS
jgi:poly(3-hydroxybutyrate) depolymerase